MTADDLSRELARRTGLFRSQAKKVVEIFFDSIFDGLVDGEKRIIIDRFGVFWVCKHPNGYYPRFRASQAFKDLLNGKNTRSKKQKKDTLPQ